MGSRHMLLCCSNGTLDGFEIGLCKWLPCDVNVCVADSLLVFANGCLPINKSYMSSLHLRQAKIYYYCLRKRALPNSSTGEEAMSMAKGANVTPDILAVNF